MWTLKKQANEKEMLPEKKERNKRTPKQCWNYSLELRPPEYARIRIMKNFCIAEYDMKRHEREAARRLSRRERRRKIFAKRKKEKRKKQRGVYALGPREDK